LCSVICHSYCSLFLYCIIWLFSLSRLQECSNKISCHTRDFCVQACEKTCYQRNVIEQCQCSDAYFPPSNATAFNRVIVPVCSTSDIIQGNSRSLSGQSGQRRYASSPLTITVVKTLWFFIPRLHDTTDYQTSWTTGCIVQTNIQPFVQPAGCLFTRYHRLCNRLSSWLNNWLHRVNKHSAGCPTGCSTGCVV